MVRMSPACRRALPPYRNAATPAAYSGSANRRGVSIFRSTAGRPGTISMRVTSHASAGKGYGTGPTGEPPTPGTSKRITSRSGSRASTSGCSTSKLAPMPQHSSSGVRSPSPGRTSYRIFCPWTVRSGIAHVAPGSGLERVQPGAAERVRRRLPRTAALAQPRGVVRPPGTRLRGRCLEPDVRVRRVLVVGLERRLRVPGRVDHGGDVPAGGQHEPALAAEQLGAAVAGLPRADVVRDPRDDVRRNRHLAEVDGRAEHPRGAGLGERVRHAHVDEVAVQ